MASSCDKQRPSPAETIDGLREMQSELEIAQSLNELYDKYLTGTPEEAKAALLEEEVHASMLKHGREANRYMQHARLHCLAKAMGEEDQARVLFVKVLALAGAPGYPSVLEMASIHGTIRPRQAPTSGVRPTNRSRSWLIR